LERAFASPTDGPLPPAVAEVVAKKGELMSRARAESGVRDSGSADPAGALGRYRVLRPLSRGGMAEILLAVHEGIGGFEKLIALKKIRRKLLERRHVAVELFLNEAKIVANLNHPNIVQTFEVGEHGGDLFIAMEYVHGVDARTLVKHRIAHPEGKISIEQVLYIGTQVAAALDHAHKARDLSGRPLHIVHRDVSLSNIVLGFDGQVKLVDFGIATAASVTAKDGLIGKFSYMSPEQVAKEPLDGRSDIFSLGIVLVEMITGVPLFRRGTDEETLRAVREDPIPVLHELGVLPEAEEVLKKALHRNRDERYPDARAFELALQSALQKHGGMSAHQLSVRMRELFPDLSAAAPTALTSTDPKASGTGTDSSGSRSFVRRSNTFTHPKNGPEADSEHSITSDMTPSIPPVVARVDAVPTPRLGITLADSNPTPTTGTGSGSTVTQGRAGEGVHFNRAVAVPAREGSKASISQPAIPAPAREPAPTSGGSRMILVLVAMLLVAALLVWLFLHA
jgi:serine/threonine-protein kinase